jgi:hypothetical protein
LNYGFGVFPCGQVFFDARPFDEQLFDSAGASLVKPGL